MRKFVVAACFLSLFGCGDGERSEKNIEVDESLLSNYSPEQYPQTYRVWGMAGVERIKLAERSALIKAARQKICDEVEYLGLSESLSAPPSKIVVFVDCANRWRLFIDQDAEIVTKERRN